jgi:hypothetical protein
MIARRTRWVAGELCCRVAALFVVLMLMGGGVWADSCQACQTRLVRPVILCPRCLRAVGWPAAPPRSRPARGIALEETDLFVRGPNDQHPRHRSSLGAGGDDRGPIGTDHDLTGLRYLIRFDLPQAFADAGVEMVGFRPRRATLVLRTVPQEDAWADLPIIVVPLTRPFAEGRGQWALHGRNEPGGSWERSTLLLPWAIAGGDISLNPRGRGFLPRQGEGEIEIDITDMVRIRFIAFAQSGEWNDPGMAIMRDPDLVSRARTRTIYGFRAGPGRGQPPPKRVLSPELYLE